MDAHNLTASGIIRFAGELEDLTKQFYEELAASCAEHRATFSAFAKDSQKHKTWVARTYQETITDALEACYCFDGLDLGQYALGAEVKGTISAAAAVKMAIDVEERAVAFYSEVARRSTSLLATIATAFARVAKARSARRRQLEALLR